MDRHGSDIGLRAGGAAALYVAWSAGAALRQLVEHHPARLHGPLAFALAGAAFLLASGGAVLVVLGRGIFARVAISPRWRRAETATMRRGQPSAIRR